MSVCGRNIELPIYFGSTQKKTPKSLRFLPSRLALTNFWCCVQRRVINLFTSDITSPHHSRSAHCQHTAGMSKLPPDQQFPVNSWHIVLSCTYINRSPQFSVGSGSADSRPRYGRDSVLNCDLCGTAVPVGTGGEANLVQHQSGTKCKNRQQALEAAKKVKQPKKETKMTQFFTKVVRALCPVSSAPPPVHPA